MIETERIETLSEKCAASPRFRCIHGDFLKHPCRVFYLRDLKENAREKNPPIVAGWFLSQPFFEHRDRTHGFSKKERRCLSNIPVQQKCCHGFFVRPTRLKKLRRKPEIAPRAK